MFDKIPSLKDFIIYLIPGILINFFLLNIINFFDENFYPISNITNNTTLSILYVIYSFLIGFIFSQIQIIVFHKIFMKDIKSLRTINNTQEIKCLKEELIYRIKTEFNINDYKENDIINNDNIIFYCQNYMKLYSNKDSIDFIDRANNLSNFAISIYFPILLGISNLILYINFCLQFKLIIFFLISILLFILIRKIFLNFREVY